MPHQVSIACKQCHRTHPFTAWQTLNASLDPKAKQQLLTGELTRFTCPDCRWWGEIVYPMLYHDMVKRLMISYWPQPGDPDTKGASMGFMKDYKFRIVSSRNELIEKIRIFDSDLDDRFVEFVKLFLRVQASNRRL